MTAAHRLRAVWQHVSDHSVWSAVIAGLILVVILAAVALVWRAIPNGEPEATRVIALEAPSVDTDHAVQGSCIRLSEKARRTGVVECEVAGEKYDPCFQSFTNRGYALCPVDPTRPQDDLVVSYDFEEHSRWFAEYFEMYDPAGFFGPLPWYLVTTDGLHCARSQAVSVTPFGMAASIECGSEYGIVCEEPEQTERLWTIRCIDVTKTSEQQTYSVEAIWY